MFAKLSTLALALPLVSALTINPLTSPTTGGVVTITWSASTSDASYFSIELVNTVFHNTFAIANNVQTSAGSTTLQLPQVPVGDGYSLEAIATNNVNTVYSQSGSFSIGDATTSSASSVSTASASSSTGSSSLPTPSTPSSTGAVSASSIASSAASGTASGSAASSSPTTLNSGGAAPLKLGGVAPAAALLLSAVAGAAMVF